ncbi:Pentatricopeptide repeat-containing protein, chloroplastic [Capsicum annuum]|uniref:Pentatricopeptide repeat-containing protein, chloroplastic n=1 Tax=Capsicum annuum TaxID=4072 RepID=A0A2G3ABF6_CAPAN|nr:pentatricopeptide repeat-containing protein At5g67570, chloroplastic [Capsicum annuum]PHT91503.1 Pentatricopeptide repeat-containing protein, chloroplastic [Capsicum annuum]
MEASTGPPHLPSPSPSIDVGKLKQNLLQNGIVPTPKIIHALRKKKLQKINRRLAKQAAKEPPPLTETQKRTLTEESYFQTIKSEYKSFNKEVRMVGRPWERIEKLKLQELSSESNVYSGDKLNSEHLWELSDIIETERDKFSWLLDNDIEIKQGWLDNERDKWDYRQRRRGEAETIRFIIDRLSGTELGVKDYKFSKLMKHSGLQYTEEQMLRLVEGLGEKGQWRHALSVVHWVYNSKEHRRSKSRFVYTKLLAVLGKARRPREALQAFNLMRGDVHIYPDIAAYHSVAVTLGQAGLLKELINIIDCMKQKPEKIKYMRRKNWDPVLQPDLVVYNAVLNACVPSRQWRGVFWVFEQLRKNGLKPNGPSYGLAMEVMLQSGKIDLVHEFFGKMKRSGEALKAHSYKVLVKSFWEEGRVNEAIQAVREMEQRGVVGSASVYYELACCLCYHGMWKEAFLEIEKIKMLCHARPLAVTFTGMILSSMDAGHVDGCICIYEHSKKHSEPDIGIINAMLKVYGKNDMFYKAKELFEWAKTESPDPQLSRVSSSRRPDAYTYTSMLECSACSLQWEYFEYVYKEMALAGYRLDQNRHAYLLVEASKAGKVHLLEHAFDVILEAGQIPHRSFFFEILCQATCQHDHERAVALIKSMVHVPQVSEKQWIVLFNNNDERISHSSLRGLLDVLCSQSLGSDVTIVNLCRALESLCGSGTSRVLTNNEPVKLTDASVMTADMDRSLYRCNEPSNTDELSLQHVQVDEDDCSDEAYDEREKGADRELVLDLSHLSHREDERAGTYTIFELSDEELTSDDQSDYSDDIDQLGLGMSSDEDDHACETKVPSAYEILKTWEDMGKTDPTFFNIQLGRM